MANFLKQRNLILEILRQDKTHPTANAVYEKARQVLPNISLGTVYRNLEALSKSGKILLLDFGDGFIHYDGDVSHHLHLHCVVCNKTEDAPLADNMQTEIAVQNGYTPLCCTNTVYGVCEECRNNGSYNLS